LGTGLGTSVLGALFSAYRVKNYINKLDEDLSVRFAFRILMKFSLDIKTITRVAGKETR
jgi:hypothetical protein